MDNKKFKKKIQILVPATDKGNGLIIEPSTVKDIVLLSDTSGKLKLGVNLRDLKEALDEANLLASLYVETKEEEQIVEGVILEGDEE